MKTYNIEIGTGFIFNGEPWIVSEVCLNCNGQETGIYKAHASNPWSEAKVTECYWTTKKIRKLMSPQEDFSGWEDGIGNML